MGHRGRGEGTIYKDPRRNEWRAELMVGTDAQGKRLRWRSTWRKTRREAAEDLARAQERRQHGALAVSNPRQSLADYLAVYLRDSAALRVGLRTFQSYEAMLRGHVLPTLGRVPLGKLTPQHLRALYREKTEEGLSLRTVQYLHAVLRRALRDAERDGIVPRNVATLVDPPRPERPEQRPLLADEARALARAVAGSEEEALYYLALTTGMRQGELLGLQWPDVDWEHRRAAIRRAVSWPKGDSWQFVEPKSKTSRRSVPLAAPVLRSLKRQRARQLEMRLAAGPKWQEHDLVFTTPLGTPLNPSNLRRRSWLPLLAKAGLPRLRFHDLRHSTATLLFGMREHPKAVQGLLGHSQIGITLDTYSHAVPGMAEEMVDRLADLIGL